MALRNFKPWWESTIEGIPVFGDWYVNAGVILDLWNTPCEVDPIIVAHAGFHNLPWLIWGIFKPTALDAAANRIRPPQRPGYHRRRRPGDRRMGFRFVANGAIRGDFQPGTGRQAAYFALGQLAQRIGFYFLIADATQDFLLRWTTTTYQWSGCLPADLWYRGRRNHPPGGVVISPGTLPWSFERSLTPSPVLGSTVPQPALQEFVFHTNIHITYGGLAPYAGPLSAYLISSPDNKRRTLFENVQLQPDQPVEESHVDKVDRATFARNWRVQLEAPVPTATVNMGPNCKFNGATRQFDFFGADPP